MKKILLLATWLITQITYAQVPSYVPTNGLVGYWPFNGNANDASGNGNNGTVNGAILTTDRNGNANSAYSFNNNSITLSPNNVFNSNQFSVSAWFKISENNLATTFSTIFSNYNSTANGYNGFWLGLLGNKANIYVGDGLNGVNIISSNTCNDGLWHLITATRNGNAYSLFLDGTLQNSQNVVMAASTTIPMIGNSSLNEEFTGKIDDIIFWNSELTAQEIATLFANYSTLENSCMPSYVPTNNLIGYWPFCGNANDESGNGINGTVNGAVLTTDRLGYQSSAYSFNNNKITLPINSNFNANQVSVSAWFNTSASNLPTTYSTIFSNYDSISTGFYGYWLGLYGNTVCIYVANVTSGVNILSSTICNDGLWHLITMTRNGNAFSLFLDGTLQNSQSLVIATNTTTIPMIGNSPLNEEFVGKIDDLVFWNRVLSNQEIMNLYAGYQNITDLPFSEKSGELIIYPNPASDNVTIDFGKYALTSGYQLNITNTLGQLVFTSPINLASSYLSLSKWGGSGTYLARIIDPQGATVNTRKIVLQ
jgi:hypothetical protein